jgi:hypothetical protein
MGVGLGVLDGVSVKVGGGGEPGVGVLVGSAEVLVANGVS